MKVLGYNLMQAMREWRRSTMIAACCPAMLLGCGWWTPATCPTTSAVLYFLSQDDYFLPIQRTTATMCPA